MKKLIIISLLIVANLGCTELDLEPLDRATEANLFNSAAEFDGALFASYSSFQKLWQNRQSDPNQNFAAWLKLTLLPSDAVAWGSFEDQPGMVRGCQELDNMVFDATIQPLQAAYSYIYEGIARANIVLDNIEKKGDVLSVAEATRIEAEAKFLRGFLHFQAMKLWGTPPLVIERITDPNSAAQPNATQDALFTQILADLQEAANGLPEAWDDANTGRATSWAALAFIGKVNVWREDWNAAITAFEQVEAAGIYTLATDGASYEDMFAVDNENASTSIFEIQFGAAAGSDPWTLEDESSISGQGGSHAESNNRAYYQGIARDVPPSRVLTDRNGAVLEQGVQSIGLYEVEADFVALFEAGDVRRESYIYEDGDTYINLDADVVVYEADHATTDYSMTGFHIEKYNRLSALSPQSESKGRVLFNNERFYRYAEMVLLYAEALIGAGRDGDALDQVNRIRVGAGLSPAAGDATTAMRLEKQIELAFEGQRTFDMMRWGVGGMFSAFPFPQAEISRSGGLLVQNNP